MPMITKILRNLKSLKKKISRRHRENPEEKEPSIKGILKRATEKDFWQRKILFPFSIHGQYEDYNGETSTPV